MCDCFTRIYMCYSLACVAGWIQTTMWVLGIEPWSYKPVSHLFSPTFEFLGIGFVTKQTKFCSTKFLLKKFILILEAPVFSLKVIAGHNSHCERSCSHSSPALRRQSQANLWVWGQPALWSKFQDSLGYTEKPCIENNIYIYNHTQIFIAVSFASTCISAFIWSESKLRAKK